MSKFQLTFLTRLFFTGTVLTGLSIAFFTASQAYSNRAPATDPNMVGNNQKNNAAPIVSSAKPRIQLAILLDTSNSMDGLINQTREQLWQMVDELSKAKRRNQTPALQVAVFEYGNDGLSASVGHVRKVVGLTSELDRVSEALFSLTTNGGQEYCGYAINTAVEQLEWSSNDEDLRLIFIAGNEPFTQGPISYADAIQLAKQRDISVSTIFAGNYQEGQNTGWQQGAILAGGNFMSIDHNVQIAHIDAPQDERIAVLNQRLNGTYLPFGQQGKESALRQSAQDVASEEVSSAYLAKRAISKASSLYNNSQWDLVDALAQGTVKLEELAAEQLPEAMRDMPSNAQQQFIADKKAERLAIQNEIQRLSKARKEFVDEHRQQQTAKTPTFNDAIKTAISEQAKKKDYIFEQ